MKCCVCSLEMHTQHLLQPPSVAACLWVCLQSVLYFKSNHLIWLITEKQALFGWDCLISFVACTKSSALDLVSLFVSVIAHLNCLLWSSRPFLVFLSWPVHSFYVRMNDTADMVTSKVFAVSDWFILFLQSNDCFPYLQIPLSGPHSEISNELVS